MFKFIMKIADHVATFLIALMFISITMKIIRSGEYTATVDFYPWVVWLILVMATLHAIVAIVSAIIAVRTRHQMAMLNRLNDGPLRGARGDVI